MKTHNTNEQPVSGKEDQDKPKSVLLQYAWNVLFALFYPFLITFSLLFTGIVWVFSGVSQVLFKLLSSIQSKNTPD